MPYIGVSPQFGVRKVFSYTATAGQTSFSGSDNNSQTLSYSDSNFIDVFQNGVLLLPSDYTATTGTSVVLDTGATVSDSIQITVFDVFSAADTVSKADGGTFDGNITMAGTLDVSGAFTSQGIDDNADATAITIDSSERVGINQSSPLQPLHLTDSDFAFARFQTTAVSVTGMDIGQHQDGRGQINLRDSKDFTISTADTERMRIFSDGTTSVGSSNSTGGDQFKINNNQSSGFCLNVNNVNATDRLIITAQSGTGTVFHHQFNNSNGSVGTISTNGSTTSYNTSSDYRLKENVTYDFDATTRLKQLKPCRFNFKADKDKTVDGFLAHEVTAVPEAIFGEKDATEKYIDDNGDEQTRIVPQGIDQAKLVPLLTKALQEQQATIEALTARITALESK